MLYNKTQFVLYQKAANGYGVKTFITQTVNVKILRE